FKGDDDLSATVSLSRLAEGVRLRVVARYDIFCQNEPSGAEWQGDSLQFAIATQNHANFEWTAALTAKGAIARLDIAPAGTKLGTADFPLVIHRDEASKETIYDLIIPSMLPDGSQLGDRFAITLLVNDNDGGGRKGYVEWTPGIGRSKDPTAYQPVVVR
ncbi:MAG: hypothetical protein P4L33_13450, partial [Capsulimonadaceae bacterium]|nr:hypothetical protein [Capsulimonadaceae bacterium]